MGLPIIRPVLPRRKAMAFKHPDWIFEPKYNGFRGTLYVEGSDSVFRGKHTQVMRPRFQEFAREVSGSLRAKNAIIDGEIVVLDEDGYSDFSRLNQANASPSFIAFDIMWLDGMNLTGKPLLERKKYLSRIVLPSPSIQLTTYVPAEGLAVMYTAIDHNWEGIIAKRKNDIYTTSTRWWKIFNPTYEPRKASKKP